MSEDFDRDKVYWWSPAPKFGLKFLAKENAGDVLGPSLVQRILRQRNLKISGIKRPKLMSIGSVMHFAKNGDTVWGSGVNGKVDRSLLQFSSLDVRAVRGPNTAEVLRGMGVSVPNVFGDPGVLTSLFWPQANVGTGPAVYVPHMREVVDKSIKKRFGVVSPLQSLDGFIKGISCASIVYSTSLHGVIIAESYGVPAVLIRNHTGETLFKYEDYYLGTGRGECKVFDSVDAAAGFVPDVPDLRGVQQELLKVFPYDLW